MRWVFSGCKSLRQVQFRDGSELSKIGDHCFQESGLRSMVLPRSVRVAGSCAFFECK